MKQYLGKRYKLRIITKIKNGDSVHLFIPSEMKTENTTKNVTPKLGRIL